MSGYARSPMSPSTPDSTPRADGSVPIKLLHDRVLVRENRTIVFRD